VGKQQSDREDLLREATALVRRTELKIGRWTDPVVVGFRRDGSASFFFGVSPVYQFNSTKQIRRAFVDDRLIKSVRGELMSMRRERHEDRVDLISSPFSAEEALAFLQLAWDDLRALQKALTDKQFAVVGQISDGADVVSEVQGWLASALLEPIRVAAQPNVR